MSEQFLYRLLGFHGYYTVPSRNGTTGVSSLAEKAFAGSTWTRTLVSKASCMDNNHAKVKCHLKSGCRADARKAPRVKKRLSRACSRHLARKKRVLGAAEAQTVSWPPRREFYRLRSAGVMAGEPAQDVRPRR